MTPVWEPVEWFGGPHDGLRQRVVRDDREWLTVRACECHGAWYRHERRGALHALIHIQAPTANSIIDVPVEATA
jgi:hypothetical protein